MHTTPVSWKHARTHSHICSHRNFLHYFFNVLPSRIIRTILEQSAVVGVRQNKGLILLSTNDATQYANTQ